MEGVDKSLLREVDAKGFVPDEVRNDFFRKLRMKSENRTCFECTARNPTWISLSYGVYLCLECSGEHRRKGVHISFVRSVELDKFNPEQMVQMGVGGNGKAWEYFKQHEMGKTSSSGRAIDYTSKVAVRYKQQIEKDTQTMCEKLDVTIRSPTRQATKDSEAPVVAEAAPVTAPPAPPMPATRGYSAPAATAAPHVVKPPVAPVHSVPHTVVAKASAVTTVPVQSVPAPAAAAPKAAGFAGAKHVAKEIEFDFDFDDLEKEAAKPPPPAPPKAAPQAAPTISSLSAPPVEAPMRAKSEPGKAGSVAGKYSAAKAISSEDFFNREEFESASDRMERENRYHKLSSASAISSSAFFGNGPSEEDIRNEQLLDEWKAVAGRGAELAKTGITKGAELVNTYLNKLRE